MKKASETYLENILGYCNEVSSPPTSSTTTATSVSTRWPRSRTT